MLAAVVCDALAAPADPELAAALGPDGRDDLAGALRTRARRWAAATAPGNAFEANTFGAAAAALYAHDGPVLLAAPDVPGLAAHHVTAALDDFAAGVAVAAGAAADGRPFLLAFAAVDHDLLDAAGRSLEELFAAAREGGGDLGLLRPERRLATIADARALLADPLAPPELRELLAPLRSSGRRV